MTEFWTGLGIVCLYFVIAASCGLVVRLCTRIGNEPFRKLLHLILPGSLAVWVQAYDTWWMAV